MSNKYGKVLTTNLTSSILSKGNFQLKCSRDPNNIKYRAVKLSNKTIESKKHKTHHWISTCSSLLLILVICMLEGLTQAADWRSTKLMDLAPKWVSYQCSVKKTAVKIRIKVTSGRIRPTAIKSLNHSTTSSKCENKPSMSTKNSINT